MAYDPILERKRTESKTKNGYFRKLNQKKRQSVLEKLGNKCAICGFSDSRALHVDHVNNDGYAERKETKSQLQRYRNVLKDTFGRYQILCANCNFIKKYEQNKIKYGEIK